MSEKSLLLTGASGLLGRAIHKLFLKRNWKVTGLAFSRSGQNLIKADLTDRHVIEDIFQEVRPSFVIHCAAQRFPDKVEKDYAATVNLNVEATKNLAQIAGKYRCPVLYISTDYVFDGTKPPYAIEDNVNPLNKYGKSKYEGELATLGACDGNIILRIPVLFGPVEYLDESAVTSLLKTLLSKESQVISNYEIRYPSHVDDIANICYELATRKLEDTTVEGLFHWCGQEPFTKYRMALEIAKAFHLSADHLKPDSNASPGATRPHNAQLDISRLIEMGIGEHTPFTIGIRECLADWVK